MSENLHPGSRVVIRDVDGNEHEDTIHSVRYTSALPEIRERPTGRRRILRDLTPRRWRKPLPIARPYEPANVEVIMESEKERRALRVMQDMDAALRRIGVVPDAEGKQQ